MQNGNIVLWAIQYRYNTYDTVMQISVRKDEGTDGVIKLLLFIELVKE